MIRFISLVFVVLVRNFLLGNIDPNGPLPIHEKVQYYSQKLNELPHGKAYNARRINLLTDLAKAYLKEKQNAKALHLLLNAKALNPKDIPSNGYYYSPFAKLFGEIGAYDLSIFYEKKILKSDKNLLGKFYSCSAIGSVYLQLNNSDSAFSYFRQQLEIAGGMNDFIAIESAKNNIGLTYLNSGNFSKARDLFEEVLVTLQAQVANRSPFFEGEKTAFFYLVEENLARAFFQLKDYEKAVEHFNHCYRYLGTEQLSSNHLQWIQALLKTNNYKAALQLKERLRSKITKNVPETLLFWDKLNIHFALYNSDLQTVALWTDQLQKDQELLNSQVRKGTAEMNNLLSLYTISEAKQFIYNERIKRKNAVNQLRLERTTMVYITVLSIVSIIILIFGYVVLYQFTKNKRQRIELEKRALELRNKTQDSVLTEYALDQSRNLELDKRLLADLERISTFEQAEISKELKTLMAELKQKLLIDTQTVEVVKNSDSLLNEFNLLLLERHPELKKSEIQLCHLIRLDLSNKEIAQVKNVTPESIKIFKNRLKHKLNIDRDLSISDYLKSIR